MGPSTPRDGYFATELLPRIPFLMAMHRFRNIEDARREGCLTPNGHSIFSDPVLCYLAQQREEGDELVAKARTFLQLAHSIGERQRYDYVRGHCEGERSADLSYINWLATGEIDGALLADARANLDAYYSQSRTLRRKTVSYMTPMLLYTESYPLIRRMAEMVSSRADWRGSSGAAGLFDHAIQIASAEDEAQSRIAKEWLRKKARRQLSTWIDTGLFTNVAFALYVLFPRPDGPPCRVIEECWTSIPESAIKDWRDSQ